MRHFEQVTKAMSYDYDLIIIGAGAAGLSLLLALDATEYTQSVKLIERRSGPQNDKIWSFGITTQFQNTSRQSLRASGKHGRFQQTTVVIRCPMHIIDTAPLDPNH